MSSKDGMRLKIWFDVDKPVYARDLQQRINTLASRAAQQVMEEIQYGERRVLYWTDEDGDFTKERIGYAELCRIEDDV